MSPHHTTQAREQHGSQHPQRRRHEQAHDHLDHATCETVADAGGGTARIGDRRGDAADRGRGYSTIDAILGYGDVGESCKSNRSWAVAEYGVDVFQERSPNDPRGRRTASRRTDIEKGTDTFRRADRGIHEIVRTHRPALSTKRKRHCHRRGTRVLVIAGPLARCGGRVGYLSEDGCDGVRGPGNVGRTGVDGSGRPNAGRYGITLDRQRLKSEEPVGRWAGDINVVDRTRVQATVRVS